MDTPSFALQQQACDPKIFKDNSTTKERIFFYVLLTFNLLLLAGACQNMVILWRRHSFKRISKILLLNTGMIATILCNYPHSLSLTALFQISQTCLSIRLGFHKLFICPQLRLLRCRVRGAA